MSTTTTPQGTVQFIQYHQAGAESGIYEIKVEQTINGEQTNGEKFNASFSRQLTIVVSGERFGPLSPLDIYAVFPPADSLGQYNPVVPHITLKRSTLPWERFPGKVDKELPWLILLLFRETDFAAEADKPKLQSMTLKELMAPHPANVKFPQITLEPGGQHPEEPVTVIDVKKKYLQSILPMEADLAYLAHVRQAKDASGNLLGEQLATILSNRLPEPSGLSSVYLVSVEGRYEDDGAFDYMSAGDDDFIRLVSLANWNFASIDPTQSFTELLKNLNRTPKPDNTPGSLRLPPNENSQAEKFLSMGYVPLPHSLREGSKTISWYRSPLTPGSSSETFKLPVRAADELVRYDSSTGLFDSSYAAAWQLGRMLTLQNQRLAIELFNWKRENAQLLLKLQQKVLNPLRPSLKIWGEIVLPEAIADWFTKLELLQGVPFNYLIPDERFLPTESIRFFWVDSFWVDCLQDGAFSIGRVTATECEQDAQIRTLRSSRALTRSQSVMTGLIMRSQVVSGWPNLLVDGYDTPVTDTDFVAPDDAHPLPRLRMEKLAKDVLICLFQGEVKTADIHLQPEAMHFGLDVADEATNDYKQMPRDADGNEIDEQAIYPIPWRNEEKGVLNIKELANKIDERKEVLNWQYDKFTSAQFALQMIEATEKVRFAFPKS